MVGTACKQQLDLQIMCNLHQFGVYGDETGSWTQSNAGQGSCFLLSEFSLVSVRGGLDMRVAPALSCRLFLVAFPAIYLCHVLGGFHSCCLAFYYRFNPVLLSAEFCTKNFVRAAPAYFGLFADKHLRAVSFEYRS